MLALWAAGCAGAPPTETDADPPTDTDVPPGGCASPWSDGLPDGPVFDAPHGRFDLRVGPGFGSVAGAVADGPPLALHTEDARQGRCRWEARATSTCDPACADGSICLQGSCAAPPQRLGAGDVFLHTSAGPIRLTDDGTGGYFADTGPASGLVVLAAAGDAVGPFDLRSCAITAPTPDGDWSAAMQARAAGEDVVLRWTDPLPGARVSLRMTTGIATHGGVAHGEIACEGPDDGSLTLPGAFLDLLYAEGWSCGECGLNELVRYRADQTVVDGHPVRLTVGSTTAFFHIPGLGG